MEKTKKIDNIRHSLAHLLAAAVLKKFPQAKLGIGPIIENGFYYDFLLPRNLTPDDLQGFQKEMKNMIAARLIFKGKKIAPAEAKKIFKNQPFKLDLIKEFTKEKKSLTVYQTGEIFTDLCRGGHVKNTKEINADAFKLISIAGAYWRGSEKNPQLQRIYGIAFYDRKELEEHLKLIEEAEKKDHRVLGEKLELFTISEKVGKGLPLWLPKGYLIRRLLEDYMYKLESQNGYLHVLTPHLAKEDLYRTSGHLTHYKDDMYAPVEIEGEKYYLKPMNCPHHHLIYQYKIRSYRDLPMRIAEFGTVYRYERSGVLSGLMRTRCFTQNDAHIYAAEEQLGEEIKAILKMHKKVYEDFKISDYWYRLSLPDFKNKEKYGDIKNKKAWNKAADVLKRVFQELNYNFQEIAGEASFYGPKIDIQIKNIRGKEDTIATIQIDFYSAPKFNLTYTDNEGKEKQPIIIHRAIFGSLDRFLAFLLEKTGGNLPVWLSPVQTGILPISDKQNKYAEEIRKALTKENIRAEINDKKETLNKKIREGETEKIPYLLIIGDREIKENSVNVRKRGEGDTGTMKLPEFIQKIKMEAQELK